MKYIDVCEKMDLLRRVNEKCTIALPGAINMARRKNIDILTPAYDYYMDATKKMIEERATLQEDAKNYKFNTDADMVEFLKKRDELNETDASINEEDLVRFDAKLLENLTLTPELFDILYMFTIKEA